MGKVIRLVVFPSILCLASCQSDLDEVPPYKPKVQASLPLFRESVEAHDQYPDIVDHPWVKGQEGVPAVTYVMCDDIRSVGPMGVQYAEILAGIQKEIPISTPGEYYSLLFLPDSSPYQIVKRQHVGDNRYGFPIYLDIHRWEAPVERVEAFYNDKFEYKLGDVGYHHTPMHGIDFGQRATYVHIVEGEGVVYAIYLDSLADEVNSLLPIARGCCRLSP